MKTKMVISVVLFLLGFSFSALGANPDGVVIGEGDLHITNGGNLVFSDGTIQGTAQVQGLQGPQGPQGVKGDTGATGPQGPAGVSGANGNAVQASQTSFGAGSSFNVATLNLNMTGGKYLIIVSNISPLTWPPAPASYGGKNHTLHVNITWNLLARGYVISSFTQTAEQNIIQLHGVGYPTTAGLNPITLQAINSSYWSLDDTPYGTTPIGSNGFNVLLSAMEL